MKNLQIALIACLLSSTAFATTLSEALISTYHNNPELIAAREKLKETDEQMYQAISGFLPNIQYTARKSYSKKDTTSVQNLNTGGVDTTKISPWLSTKSRSTSLQIEQNVFNGGRTVMAVRMAKNYIDAGRAELLSKEEEVLASAIKSFFSVIYTKEILELNKQNVLSYEKKYETIKERVLAGVEKQADLALIGAEKANSYTELTIASGQYELALASYIKDIGMEADHLVKEDLGVIPSTQIELLNNALRTNPQLLNVIYQQKAADINVYSKAASLLPTVDIGGSISKEWNKSSTVSQAQPC